MNEDRWPTGLTSRAPVRRPGGVPDEGVDAPVEIGSGADTDGDAVPDTVLTTDGADLLVYTDLDADGLADRVLRIDTGGVVRPDPYPGVDDPVTGSASAGWSGLIGVFLGTDP
ncbi:MAG TPA: hypothetical protein VFY38_03425 [Pseudonocardia sp.]|nr:hypothetical protein [Pseudonocardia sp.]